MELKFCNTKIDNRKKSVDSEIRVFYHRIFILMIAVMDNYLEPGEFVRKGLRICVITTSP